MWRTTTATFFEEKHHTDFKFAKIKMAKITEITELSG
jgi:hypothetical protein